MQNSKIQVFQSLLTGRLSYLGLSAGVVSVTICLNSHSFSSLTSFSWHLSQPVVHVPAYTFSFTHRGCNHRTKKKKKLLNEGLLLQQLLWHAVNLSVQQHLQGVELFFYRENRRHIDGLKGKWICEPSEKYIQRKTHLKKWYRTIILELQLMELRLMLVSW